jgi:DNA-binding response OmpR family regulator
MTRAAAPAHHERALVVDDSEFNRKLLRTLLHGECDGIHVDEAGDVDSAIGLLSTAEYDVVLLDLNLDDGADGLRVLQHVRRTPGLDGTPVILVSSRSPDDAIIERALREGADDFVVRPAGFRILGAKVSLARKQRRRWLGLRRDAEAARRDAVQSAGELDAAAKAQRAPLASVPASFGAVTVTAGVVPCHTVSGDLYDIVVDEHGRITVVLVDATGHGGAAGVVASSAMAALRQGLRLGLSLPQLFESTEACVGAAACDRIDAVALALARFDQFTRTIEVANAGMPSLLLVDTYGRRSTIRSGAPPLGLVRGRYPAPVTFQLDTSGVLLLASDGLDGSDGGASAHDELARRIDLAAHGATLARSSPTQIEALIRELMRCDLNPLEDDASLVVAAFDWDATPLPRKPIR